MTTLDNRATLRTVAFTGEDDASLTADMTSQVPPRGITHGTTGSRIPRSALRLVESRILATTLSLLDEDPGPMFAKGLGALQNVMTAARTTRADPARRVVETILDPYRLPIRRAAHVALVVEDRETARVDFELEVVFAMGRTTVALRQGAVDFVECEVGAITVSLSLTGTTPPLLHRKADFPVHWDVRPPIVIPLPETNRRDSNPGQPVTPRPHTRPYGG